MSDALRFARRRRYRFSPRPSLRRRTLPLPVVVIGCVILLVTYGAQIFHPAPQSAPAPAPLEAVRAVDGDTLRAGDLRIRLIGIDAPEKAQTCRDAQSRAWACGIAAREQLEALVAHGAVRCAAQGHDRYGRTLAVCSAGDVADIGGALVRAGYAVSYMDRDERYAADESAARAQGLGLWVGAFERPSDYRRRHRRAG
jgi:endonuclease YncB( thermonuclease family)